ncbi:MAG: hypothetical protein ACYCSB_02030 [bacterium]
MEELINVCYTVIDKFRGEYEKLDEIEKAELEGNINLAYPTQIDIFILEGLINFNLFFITHDDKEKDKNVLIHGPFQAEDFLNEVQNYLESDEKWVKLIPENSPIGNSIKKQGETGRNYGEEMINYLLHSLPFGYPLFNPPIKNGLPPYINLSKNLYGLTVSAFWFFGDIDKDVIDRFFEININSARRIAQSKQNPSSNTITASSEIKGYGVYIYPPIWIGKIKKPDLAKNVSHPFMHIETESFYINFDGKYMIFRSDGLIGINVSSKEDAIKIFNVYFAVAYILNLMYCFAAKEDDIADITIDENKFEIRQIGMSGHSQRRFLMNPTSKFDALFVYKRQNITKESAEKIANITKRIINDKRLVFILDFFIQGLTYFNNKEYSQSFILEWISVEYILYEEWEKLLKDKKITGERKKDMLNPIKWDFYHRLELLNYSKNVNDDDYKLLRELNIKRNKLIHSKKEVSKEDIEKLLNFVLNIKLITEIINNSVQA